MSRALRALVVWLFGLSAQKLYTGCHHLPAPTLPERERERERESERERERERRG